LAPADELATTMPAMIRDAVGKPVSAPYPFPRSADSGHMNLSTLIDAPLQHLQRQLNIEAQRVQLVAEAKAGRILAAVVTEVSALTDAERAQVLHRLKQELASAQFPPDALRANTLKRWSTEPLLHLVSLKAGGREFSTVTPLSLQAQQAVKVLVRADGQLQLLDSMASQTSLKTQQAYGLRATTHTAVTTEATKAAPALNPAQLQLISASLRNALPQQASLKSVMQFVTALETALAPHPQQLRKELLPPDVMHKLQALTALAPTPKQLSQPEGLRQALQQSGNLFEGKLMALPDTTATPRRAQQLESAMATREPSLTADIKAVLLQALHHIQQHQSSAGSTQPFRLPTGSERLIASLLGLLPHSPRDKQPAEAKKQLMQQLVSQISGALAKIQTQQLQSLNQRLGEMGQPSLGGYFELPVRLPDGYSSVSLHIQEYWDRQESQGDEDAEARRERKTVPQWEVMLDFDLGEYGQLTSQLRVMNGTVSANFWAEKPHTRALAQEQLAKLQSQMEASGLQVTDIQCLPGQPPQRPLKLNYNLVDITT
jgi:hypothetical protein